MKTPSYYIAPLRSRAAITAWLLDRAKNNPRTGYGLFCYNVKLYDLDLSFDNLAAIARKSGELSATASPRYLDACRAIHEDAGEQSLCDVAAEDATRSLLEDDTSRMLWDSDGVIAEWGFEGRFGGWLVLREFDGVKLEGPTWMIRDAWIADLFAESSYRWLRNLYRFLIQCDHDFKRPETEVEYQAAFHLFARLCDNVETDKQEAARLASEQAEQTERAYWETREVLTAN